MMQDDALSDKVGAVPSVREELPGGVTRPVAARNGTSVGRWSNSG